MIGILYGPKWFYGMDLIIDVFSVIVLLLIGYFSIKNYKLSGKNKNHLWISGSFFLLALGALFDILTNFTIYYRTLITKEIGLLTLTYQGFVQSNLLYIIGITGYKILTLIGLYLLFMLYKKNKSPLDFVITTYLLLVSVYFVHLGYLFNITASLLLMSITYEYFVTYKKNKHPNTKLLACSFGIITLSHIFSIFLKSESLIYVSAESIQLIGYSLLLFTFIKVLKNAKKAR